MQKKILICLLLVMALLIPNLASCGFGGSDALEIENIGVEILEDGTSKITIKYFDDIEEPVVFYVPAGQMGEKGETGETGNGIKEIVLSNKEDGVQTMYIHYTEPSLTRCPELTKTAWHICLSSFRTEAKTLSSFQRELKEKRVQALLELTMQQITRPTRL